ncbi:MAG: hypothetical protein H3C41_05145 [Bacteroidales bacterium]|nr:hypothetical protein [Bacteroidales bacterium]
MALAVLCKTQEGVTARKKAELVKKNRTELLTLLILCLMKQNRRKFSSAFETQVALAAVKGLKAVSEIA